MKKRVVVLVALLAACADDRASLTAPVAHVPSSLKAVIPVSTIQRPQEEKFVQLAQEVPSFAGYYYDRGDLVVALTDTTQASRALALIARAGTGASASAHKGKGRSGRTRVLAASHAFLDLKRWRDAVFGELMESDSVAYLDLDERANTVTVGILDSRATAWVQQVAAKQGVPERALVIDTTVAAQPYALLTERVRPLRAGLQLRRTSRDCALGYIALHGVDNGFLTASHCTGTFWGADQRAWFQGTPGVIADSVGREVHDPPGFACGFRGRKTCRYSDVAVIGRATSQRVLGSVFRTINVIVDEDNFGSTQIASPVVDLTVTSQGGSATVGDQLDKVAHFTGWTSGEVSRTCSDIRPDVDNSLRFRVLCQDETFTFSAPGESGAPVFVLTTGSTVQAHGILWGGDTRFGFRRSLSFVSPMVNIQLDLGGLSVVAP